MDKKKTKMNQKGSWINELVSFRIASDRPGRNVSASGVTW